MGTVTSYPTPRTKGGGPLSAQWSDATRKALAGPGDVPVPVGIDTYTWAELQTAYPNNGAALLALPANAMAFVSDWQAFFVRNTAGTYWSAVSPTRIVLDLTLSSGTLSGANQIVKQAAIAPGILRACRKFVIRTGVAKDGATDAVTSTTILIGPAGTTADPVHKNLAAMTAGNRTQATENEFFVLDSARLSWCGGMNNSTWSGTGSGNPAIAVNSTGSNIDTTTQYLSIAMQMAGTTNKPQAYHLELELVP